MILPDWPTVNITRRKEMVASRGINYSDNFQEGDLAGSENLSVRRWPYIATRNGRKRVEGLQDVTALTSWNGLVAVIGTDLYYKGEKVTMPEGVEMTAGSKTFAAVNTKLVIWPDKVYLDLSGNTVKSLGAEATATKAVFDDSKKKVTLTGAADLRTLFKVGDGIEISGLTDLAGNNISIVVKTVTKTAITTAGEVFTPGTETAAVTVERKIPDLDYICESGNRLWGVSNETKTIYSSALGDPTNFYVFQGASTDSYAVAVASPGDFTGCCKLASSILFWKEHNLHKMLGSYPAEYVMYSYDVEGVRAGCAKSMTIINDTLFYVGLHGVYAYGGGTPVDISTVFGEHLLTDAVGGTDGEKYYLSCLDNKEKALYVYDTNERVWLREDGFRFTDIARDGEDVYLLRDDGSVWLADSREPDPQIEWRLEYKPFYETIEGRKRVSRLLIRMEMPEGAWLRVETSTDDERWQETGLIKGPKTDTVPLMVQPRRGDMYKVRLRGHGPCVIKGVLREYLQGGYQGGYD